jgi:integrase
VDLYELLSLYRLYRPQLAETTAEQYRYAIRSLEKFVRKSPTTEELTEPVILRFLSARLAEVSTRTVKRERGDILTLWRFAWRRKLCRCDPRDAEIPHLQPRTEPPIALTVQQVEAILDSCRFERSNIRGTEILKSAWWRALVLVLYWSGARIGAIIEANRDDLDSATGWLHLRAESAKTGSGQWCQLPLDVVRAIPVDPASESLFPWPYGRRQLFAALKRIVVRAGLPAGREYRFHAFRRTAATLATAESSLDVARRALGHSRESMTLRYIDPRVSSQPLLSVLPKVVG